MNASRLLLSTLLLALAGGTAFAREDIPWGHQDYAPQFSYFAESGAYTPETWAELALEKQELELRETREPAQERLLAIEGYYSAVMTKWDSARLRDYTAATTRDDVSTVNLWLGNAKAAAMAKKLALTGAMLRKAGTAGLKEAEAAALSPYLTPEAIAELRGLKAAAGLQEQAASTEYFKKHQLPKGAADATLQGVSGSLSGSVSKSMAKAFDGSTATGDVAPVLSGGGPAALKAAGGAATGFSGAGAAAPGTKPRSTTATTVRATTPEPPAGAAAKSSAWTSDAYGFTITANGKTQTFRDSKQAETAIKALPPGSVSKVVFYGHGSPGMQTVGPATYDSESTAELLKGKMTKDGVIQFSGCNTASIGDATLNPAVGISMVARRLLYFSLPYFQDRADGVQAAQAKEQWEKGWNADLAKDTSHGVKGTIVCGYRTFGLVPGRLPGLTKVLGNQEATSSGYIAGKLACYRDGIEVPAP